ncbi:MAG TPA: HNH endonuclease signature motif containing protein, partial [Myxococcales bacterium]
KAVQERGVQDAGDEPWDRIDVRLTGDQRARVDEAMELADRLLGATAQRWQRIELIAGEFLSALGPAGADVQVPDRARDTRDALEEWLERESREWAFLDRMLPVPALESTPAHDPQQLDAALRRLAELRDRWDQVFGHLALVFRTLQGWRRLGFASFDHYCIERLGMAGRTVAQRAQLERRLHEVPALAAAVRERRLSYEKARLLARHLEDEGIATWIDRAERMTCISLRRALQQLEDAQMCARGDLVVRGPRRVCALFLMACAALRRDAGKWIGPGECLARMAGHFVGTWGPALRGRQTLQKEVLARDQGLCQAPGCSRAAAHAHHVVYRSMGGADEAANLVSLCAAHHLHGVHRGWIRVEGRAPEALRWRLGA